MVSTGSTAETTELSWGTNDVTVSHTDCSGPSWGYIDNKDHTELVH